MKLYFRTRDAGIGNDYPNIDWMPPLPTGADRLWRRFGDCQDQTYPQLVLSSKGGSWILYLEGLDSGRNDALSGIGGRIIRNSLYVTGKSIEADDALKILSAYVEDLKTGKEPQKTFLSAFEKTMKPGAARATKNAGIDEQGKVADSLLSAIRDDAATRMERKAFPTESTVKVATVLTDDGKANFLTVCRSLLSGVRDGCAVALATARVDDKSRVEQMAKEPLVAFLSIDERDLVSSTSVNTGADDKSRKALSETSDKTGNSFGWEVEQDDNKVTKADMSQKIVAGGVVIGSLLFLFLLFRWLFPSPNRTSPGKHTASGVNLNPATNTAVSLHDQ